jgi:hypothetical protein
MPAVTAPSRTGRQQLSGHFPPEVIKAMKLLAIHQGTTVQSLLAQALNDLFAKHGLPRIAAEVALPRGGAARRREQAKPSPG